MLAVSPWTKRRRSAAKCCLLGDSGRRNLDQPPQFIARVRCHYRNTPTRHIRTHLLCALSNRWDVSYSQSVLERSNVNHSVLAASCSQPSCSPRVHLQSMPATPYPLHSFLYLGDSHVHNSQAKSGKGKQISREVLSSRIPWGDCQQVTGRCYGSS